MSARPLLPRLFAITDSRFCGGPDALVTRVGSLLEEGLRAVILREKDLRPRDLHALGRRLLVLCRQREALLLVNDRIDVALALGADGIQLPGGSLAPLVVRPMIPPHWLVGCSCHDARQLRETTGADFALVSPYRQPGSHPTEQAPLGEEGLRRLVGAARGLPLLALGGIEQEDIPGALAAGAWGVAAISGLLRPGASLSPWLQRLAMAGKNSPASSSPG
ncbi:thiamine phosphate synthase [bacterium]|nr:thiamine phosphate synthase [bacterium]